jgi:hypothetical protein
MKTIDIDREIRGDGRDASKAAFAKATIRYKPATVRVLFIAEAPPAFRFNRLFYFEDLRDGDTLFLEMMKTLYGSAAGFTENGFSSGSSAEGIRSRKSELLARFEKLNQPHRDARRVHAQETQSAAGREEGMNQSQHL